MSDVDYFEYPDDQANLDDAEHIRTWAKANWSPISGPNPHRVHIHLPFDWAPFIQAWAEAFRKVAIQINAMFPNGVAAKQARRREAKRVHTAYRQRRGRRW